MQTGQGSAVAFDLRATGEAERVEAVAVEIWLDGMVAPVRYIQRYRRVDEAPVRADQAMVAGACAWPGDEAPLPPGGLEELLFFKVTRLRRGGIGAGMTAPLWGSLLELAGRRDSETEGRWVVFRDASSENRYFRLPWAHVEACQESLARLCQAPLAISSVWDTSDQWEQLTLDIQWNQRRYRVDLSLMASGFEGPDEPRLQRALEALDTLLKGGLQGGGVPTPIQTADYGFDLTLDHVVRDLERAGLGPFYRQESPIFGYWYTSVDLEGLRKARAHLRAIEDASRGGLSVTSPTVDDVAYVRAPGASRYELTASGLAEHLDAIEEKMRAAGLAFKTLRRGPPSPTASGRP